jgi:hypothetical protein
MRNLNTLPALLPALLLAGCASLATQRMAGHLETAMLDQDDPETVRAAAPAFLLLTESMIAEQPDDPGLLAAGSQLAAAYAALLQDPQRRERLEARSYDYATRALCAESAALCQAREGSYEDFTAAVDKVGPGGLEVLYVYGTAWAAWMQRNAADWAAVADLPKLEYLFDHILSIDPAYRKGRAQLYAGALAALRPPALGGDPDKARAHFEAALQQSERRDLMVQVEYARRYARLVLDQPLHDRLLNEVLAADADAPGLTLTNLLAKEEAERLLAEDYFAS